MLADCDRMDEVMSGTVSRRRGRSVSPSRSRRSSRQSVSPDSAHTAYSAVLAAIHRRHHQVEQLTMRLESAHEQEMSLSRQLDDTAAECQRRDMSVRALNEHNDSL